MGKEWLQSTQKAVKDATIEIYVEIYKQTGEILKEKMLDGLKGTQADAINAEFAKIPPDQGRLEFVKHEKFIHI